MNFKEVESKWQKVWTGQEDLFKAYDSDLEYEKAKGRKPKGKKYILVEFPYPSGTGLHIGHVFCYTAGDVYARFLRLSGYNVLFPMGWDAFGLPTENYAIKTKRKPQEITKETTDYCRQQMKKVGLSFDWSRELFTTDPQYYAWTQWIFIKLWEKGLASKQKMPINWCPSCKIGLANEEVIDGKCERCGTLAEKRDIEQWVIKITEYANRLIDGLKQTDFVEKVKAAQISWVGRKQGARIKFDNIEVFTTRPDTVFGVSAVVVAPEHQILKGLNKKEVLDYLESVKNKSDLERTDLNKDKTGVFTGLYVANPVNGKQVPVWVADYVLNSFGTGAIMLVPAHDSRDFEFAKKYNLEILKVVEPLDSDKNIGDEIKPFEGDGIAVNSGFIDGIVSEKARVLISDFLAQNGSGRKEEIFHLRDWIFSRQHYWGEPVPMWREQGGDWKPVPETDLPVVLPEVEHYEPTDDGKSPLSKISGFVEYGKGERETDTMPNWAGSDWYFVGYLIKEVMHNYGNSLPKGLNVFDKNKDILKYWMPVDVYFGGDEHTTLHLLYSRFIYQFLHDLGYVPTPEPYYRRISHGVILAPDGKRMSKSKGNTIDPIPLCDEFGADVVRTSMMFMGPFDSTMPWNPNTVAGVKRFLDRMERFILKQVDVPIEIVSGSKFGYESILNKTIKSIFEDLSMCKFNTPVAKLMTLLNEVENNYMMPFDRDKLIIILSIYAPYLAEELWYLTGHVGSVHEQEYPTYDDSLILSDIFMIPVCINGKKRGEVEIKEKDKASEVVAKWLVGKEVIKTIYIENKMVNLVVR